MHLVKIRYNHDAGDSGLFWRVIINGVEHLASDLEIHGAAYTTQDEVEGVGKKYHITCEVDSIHWDKNKIVLVREKNRVSKLRHILKSITYRFYSSTITSLIAAFLTGSITIGFSIGTADFFIKIFTYYIHERIWYKIPFGLEKIKKK
jgi:uncharacterized membrane protein